MSALVPLTITHAGGTRVLELYQVDARTRSYSVRLEPLKGALREYRALGDRLENPSTLNITAYLEEPTIAASYQLAYQIIDEADSASQVEYHEGVQLVDGIVGASITVEGLGLRLGLQFAPTKPGFEVVGP